MNVKELYTTKEEVIAELKKRWKDKELDNKLVKFLNGNIPEFLLGEPRAILPRQLTTPDNEFMTFFKKSEELGLKPVGFEFLDDIFITTNHGKACLGKMIFYEGIDKNGRAITSSIHSIDLSGPNEKKKIKDIKTLWGENFVEFHHRILKEKYDIEVFDQSKWYNDMGGKAKIYYKYYIALLAVKNVLFENFAEGREEKFLDEVFLPAIEFVKKEFGVKPLIMPIAPPEDTNNIYWWSYPKNIKDIIKK